MTNSKQNITIFYKIFKRLAGKPSMYIIENAAKDTTFQIRINGEIKAELERIYAKCGMSLTDAMNCFFQQSLNIGGLPFLAVENSDAQKRLMTYMEILTNGRRNED